jgi:hypothetical protein
MGFVSVVRLLVCALLLAILVARGSGGHNRQKHCNNTKTLRTYLWKQWTGRLKPQNTGCPTHELWLAAMHRVDPAPNKVFVNIGFNKGMNFANWVALWLPATNIDPPVWSSRIAATVHQGEHKFDLCGVCEDCKVTFPPTAARPVSPTDMLRLFGVDLNSGNVELMKTLDGQLRADNAHWKAGVTLTPIHAGMGRKAGGTVWVKKCFLGNEKCKILEPAEYWKYDIVDDEKSSAPARVLRVPLLSVDALVVQQKLRQIDILMIDTEGHDPAVLEGAMLSLEEQVVRCFIFEYHNIGLWAYGRAQEQGGDQEQGAVTLESLIQSFEPLGYECYFEGRGLLWPLSNGEVYWTIQLFSAMYCVSLHI